MMPLKPQPARSSALHRIRRQAAVFQQPMFWGATTVMLLSGWFLLEYWQPQIALNRGETNSAPRPNPLRYGNSSNADSYTGDLPPLPSVLPPAANPPLPIDPTLTAAPSSQDKAQPNSRASQPAANRDSSLSDLYNPAGIPMPRAWETQPSPAASPAGGRPVGTPTAGDAPPSPLQSALDRMSAPQVPAVLPQSGEAVSGSSSTGAIGTQSAGSGSIGSSSSEGAIGGMPAAAGSGFSGGQTLPQSSSTMPRSTGYTMPPAFRTTNNTPSFGSPTTSPAAPDTSTTLPLNPAPLPQSNLRRGMGNGEINTFSNP